MTNRLSLTKLFSQLQALSSTGIETLESGKYLQFIESNANNVFKKDPGEKCTQESLDLPAGAQTVRLGGNHGLHISRTVRGEHWSFFQSLFRSQP